MKRVYPIESRCIGCRLCEIACIVAHSRSRDAITSFQREGLVFNNERARPFVDPAEAMKAGRPRTSARCTVSPSQPYRVSTRCRHCDDAECVLACKTGALYTDPEGRVLLDESRCVGCWMCIMACPNGAISRNPALANVPDVENNGINHHCDLCVDLGLDTPACVRMCPVAALVFEDRDNPGAACVVSREEPVSAGVPSEGPNVGQPQVLKPQDVGLGT